MCFITLLDIALQPASSPDGSECPLLSQLSPQLFGFARDSAYAALEKRGLTVRRLSMLHRCLQDFKFLLCSSIYRTRSCTLHLFTVAIANVACVIAPNLVEERSYGLRTVWGKVAKQQNAAIQDMESRKLLNTVFPALSRQNLKAEQH